MKKRMLTRWQGLKLSQKFTLITGLLVWLPVLAFCILFFRNMQDNLLREKESSMAYELQESYGQIVKNVESINMSTQIFASDRALLEFLEGVRQNKEMDIGQLREFYREDIAFLERLVNNNPYLYQVRVYAPSDTMQEMMPVLYRKKRMERLAWAQQDAAERAGWHFNYADTLFDSFVMDQNEKIMSCVTELETFGTGQIGTLEVAMRMETMFPHLYDGTQTAWSFFVDQKGERYPEKEILGEKDALAREIAAAAGIGIQKDKDADGLQNKESGQLRVERRTQGSVPLIVGVLPIRELSGTLVRVYDMREELGAIRTQRNALLAVLLVALVLLTFLISRIVRGILGQFYDILFSIRQVQKGDLSVVIQSSGSDEMAELGTQINKMLERIRKLMEENINREVLVKNSEIKALQNQINAHFIYNVLESVKMMAEIDEEYEISDALTRLGKLLRYSMRWTSQNVTVQEELEYIRNYLALINLRFDYEIYLSENLPELVLIQEIPKMSLQPIVENAIYHGIEEMAEDTNIYIKGYTIGEDCVIEITDAGNGMDEETLAALRKKIAGEMETSGGSGNGIGLKNVQDRIHMSFGERYGIEVASRPACYTKVSVRIPITNRSADRTKGNLQQTAGLPTKEKE